MSSIGSAQFYLLTGRVNPQTPGLEDITRDNIDGQGYRLRAEKSAVTQHQSEADTDTAANAQALEASYAALVGTLQTVTYDDGQQVENVAVLGVQVTSVQKVETPVGGIAAGNWVVKATWQLQGTE